MALWTLALAVFCLFASSPASAQNLTTFAGQTSVGSSALQTVTVTAQAAGTVNAVNVLTLGQPNLDYSISGANSCAGANLTVGSTCQVAITFAPIYPGPRNGAIVLVDSSNNVLATQYLAGTGLGSVAVMVPGTMNTVVGSGQWTAVDDGAPATEADLYLPSGVAVDGIGNIFVADSFHNRIREVYATGANKGLIETICNVNGVASYTGDGASALNATLNNPRSIALDGAGNIYIADSGNNVIREINASTGNISTIAGNGTQGFNGDGAATSREFNGPYGVTVDAAGDVYIADTNNQRIREFVAGTATITTIVGKGDTLSNGDGEFSGDGGSPTAADLSLPYAVAFDASGNMYIPDSGNNRIRIVYAVGVHAGTIGTFAGNGSPTYAGDGGTPTSASFYAPSAVAVDVAGNLYIGDTQNNRVRKISSSTNLVSTIAGNGTGDYGGDGASATAAGMFGPYALFLDGPGDLFIADYFDHRIREIQSNNVLLTFTPAIREDQVSSPQSQTIENDGNSTLTFSAITPDANAAVSGSGTTCSTSASVAIGATCKIAAEFAPTEVGDPVIGNIVITGNPADAPLDVQVSGQALELTSTTTALSTSANPALYHASVTLTATVTTGTGTLSGTVTFKDGSTTLGTSTLSTGGSGLTESASFTTSALTVGAHSLSAVYNSDGVHSTSTSPAVNENILEPTSVVVTSGENPSISGDSVTFTVTVTPAADGGTAPTGTITFYNGSSVIGSSAVSGNTASITASSLTVATHSITAAYGGDSENQSSTSPVLSQVVNATASTAVITSNNNPSIATKSVTFTVTVTGVSVTPTGSVAIKDGTATLATLTLSGGSATYTTSSLSVATHFMTAVYAGDSNNAGTTSAALSQVVNQATTTTVVGASASSIIAGKSVSLTATVTGNGGTPGGSVKFYSQGNLINSATLNGSGIATLSTATLAVGSDAITAVYQGDPNDAGSSSSAYSLTVTQATSSVNLVSSLNPATVLKQVTFTAAVTGNGGTPTGQVIFSDGATPLATVSLDAGVATYSTTSLAAGQHTITAAYQGDANDSAVTANLTETIQQANPTLGLTSSQSPSLAGASVLFTATLAGTAGTPIGSVVFADSGVTIGTVNIAANGTATFSTAALSLGQHSITASYIGDANNAAARSTPITQTVQETTSTTLVSNNDPSIGGTSVTLTATVTGSGHGSVTGSVTFSSGAVTLGVATVNGSGVAAYTSSTLPVGATTVTATYSGDALNDPSTSSSLTQTVQSTATTTLLTSSANPSLFGANVIFTATVSGSGGTPTGTVTFSDGATVLATASLNASGAAIYSTASLTPGIHSIAAAYSGDTYDNKSASAAISQQVQAHTVVTLTSNTNPSLAAAAVTFTVNVTNGTTAPPTGTVTLEDGTTTLSTFTVPASGPITFTTSSLAVGAHSITAVYSGDTNDTAQTSAVLTQTIETIPTKTTLAASPTSLTTNQQANLTASVFSAGSAPMTGTLTFQNGSTVIGSTTLGSSGIATITPTLAVGAYNIVAVYSGDVNNAPSTSVPVPVTVTQGNDFEMALNPPAVTVATKQYTVVTLTLMSSDGFTDQLGLGCGSLPASVTCNFSSATVTLPANGTVTAQVTIDTASPLTSGGSAKNVMPGVPSSRIAAACFLPGGALIGLLWWRSRRRFHGLFCAFLVMLLSGAAITLTGCAGLSDDSAKPGTYTIQITADGAKTGMTHAINVTVTVTQ